MNGSGRAQGEEQRLAIVTRIFGAWNRVCGGQPAANLRFGQFLANATLSAWPAHGQVHVPEDEDLAQACEAYAERCLRAREIHEAGRTRS